MNFQQWQQHPVYKTQCATSKLAQQLLGLPELAQHQGLATSGDHILATFHAFPQYRTPEAKALRLRVAQTVKLMRKGTP